ncbi:MAG: N-acetyltransferase [Marinosulfonomonas sp.]|nr:N-acetyltransferase [Marinosulfonomonas sp.]
MLETIDPATPADFDRIDEVLRAAFPSPEEAVLVARLRKAGDMVLELVARGPDIVGYIAVSQMVAPKGWLCLAPLAVAPEAQGLCIGSQLTRAAVNFAAKVAKAPICVLGKVTFYERQGFSRARAAQMRSPYPIGSTMLAGPGDDSAQGELIYPAAFDGLT